MLLHTNASAATLQVPSVHEVGYSDFKKRVYSNYEFLLEQEN